MSATIYDEPSGCNCANKTTYTSSSINAACQQALQLASAGKTLGRDKYPHVYNDYEKFQFPNAQKPYLEFPVMADGKPYDADSPGADRVVIGSIATDYASAVFCAVLTHDGSTKNGFAECKDDTVNAGGEGTYKRESESVEERVREGREKAEGRELLERIDL